MASRDVGQPGGVGRRSVSHKKGGIKGCLHGQRAGRDKSIRPTDQRKAVRITGLGRRTEQEQPQLQWPPGPSLNLWS